MNLYLVEIKQSILLTVFSKWVQGGVIISQYQGSRRRKGEGTERFWGWREMSLGVITIKWDKAGTESSGLRTGLGVWGKWWGFGTTAAKSTEVVDLNQQKNCKISGKDHLGLKSSKVHWYQHTRFHFFM